MVEKLTIWEEIALEALLQIRMKLHVKTYQEEKIWVGLVREKEEEFYWQATFLSVRWVTKRATLQSLILWGFKQMPTPSKCFVILLNKCFYIAGAIF